MKNEQTSKVEGRGTRALTAVEQVGQRVTQAREALGLSVSEAADQAGVYIHEWRKIECADIWEPAACCLIHVLRFLAHADVSLTWLLTGQGEMAGDFDPEPPSERTPSP